MKRSFRFRVAAVLAAAMGVTSGWAETYYYRGGGTDPNKWDDPNNWTNAAGSAGYPWGTGPEADAAIIPDGFGPSFNAGTVPAYLQRLQTGNMLVTIPSSLTITYNSTNGWQSGIVSIGTGGLTVNGGIGFGNWAEVGFFSAGPVTMTYLQMCMATPTQTGGYYNIGTIKLQGNGTGQIRAWAINNATNTTITSYSHNGCNHEWAGNPILDGRPNWDLIDAGVTWNASGGKWDLKNHTLYGNRLRIDGGFPGGGAANPYPDYLVSDGGTIDVNRIQIALGASGNGRSHVRLSNTAIHIRGDGTAWENNSTNAPAFTMTNNTTVTFHNSCNLDTGSKDRNSVARDPADWVNNFAFDKIFIAEGATVTLTGNANIEGGGNTALYATSMEGLGTGASVNLNGRNIYLLKKARNITFIGTGKVYQQADGTLITIQ